MDDIICRVIDLPPKVNAMVSLDTNGDYNVYINARLSYDAQRRAYRHECRHIVLRHLYSEKSVLECEREARA